MKIFVMLLIAALCSAATASGARPDRGAADPMPWLGPLPANLSQETLRRGFLALADRIQDDLNSADGDLSKFVCKNPSQVGPAAQMAAVNAYLDAWPDGARDEALMRELHRAAAAGNWLARAQLYAVVESDSLVGRYRILQLAQWMQRRKLGPLYARFGDDLAASGFYSDTPGAPLTGIDLYAALHHSYAAQHKAGQALSKSDDLKTAAIGRAMLACASAALPAYRRIFSGEAEQAATQRRAAAREARLPPLQRAVKHGDPDQVAQLLAAMPGAADTPDEYGQTALDLALLAKPPQPRIVAMLIAHGARVTEERPVDPSAPDTTQLGVAVAAEPPTNLALVKLLMQAGADPFAKSKVNEFVFATPFAHALIAYAQRGDAAVIEFMLASAGLAPGSALATEYADEMAHSLPAFERLLAYGAVPSGAVFANLLRGVDEAREPRLGVLRKLLERHPHLHTAMAGDSGAAALSQAVYDCRFDHAVALANLGAPLEQAERARNLLYDLADNCDDLEMRGKPVQARRTFLELLAARGYDFNAEESSCPAWLPHCLLPDEKLVYDLLDLGADPYRLYAEHNPNAISAAISACKPALAERMLAKPPAQRDALTMAGLTRAAEQAADSDSCPDGHEMHGVLARLLAYGAVVPAKNREAGW